MLDGRWSWNSDCVIGTSACSNLGTVAMDIMLQNSSPDMIRTQDRSFL